MNNIRNTKKGSGNKHTKIIEIFLIKKRQKVKKGLRQILHKKRYQNLTEEKKKAFNIVNNYWAT